jgi:hypothetical protein
MLQIYTFFVFNGCPKIGVHYRLLIILALVAIVKAADLSSGGYYYRVDTSPLIVAGILYIIMAIVIIILGTYLFKAANGYSRYSFTKNSNELETAFLMQKRYWKTAGIFTIVCLGLMLLALLVFVGSVSRY